MKKINEIEYHIIKKSWIASSIWLMGLLYLIILYFITPIYKFCEVYFDYPKINFSAIRLILFLITLSLISLLILTNNNRLVFVKRAISTLVPAITCISLVIIIIIISYPFVQSYASDALNIYLLRVDACVVGYSMIFIAGFFFDHSKRKATQQLFMYLWVIFTVFIFFNLNILIASFILYGVYEKIINYIFLSNGYLFFSIFLLYFIEKQSIKILIWAIVLIVMFFVPSRSNTICFIFATLFPLLFNLKRLLYFFLTLVLFISFFGYILSGSLDSEIITRNRTFSSDLEIDTSLEIRLYQANKNFENLQSTWFFGDFMGDIRIHGEDGNETHSYISFWEQFGIIPFLLMLISVFTLLYYLYLLRRDTSQIYKSTLILSLFFIPSMLFAKSYGYNLIWFMIPRIVVYYQSLKYEKFEKQKTNQEILIGDNLKSQVIL